MTEHPKNIQGNPLRHYSFKSNSENTNLNEFRMERQKDHRWRKEINVIKILCMNQIIKNYLKQS